MNDQQLLLPSLSQAEPFEPDWNTIVALTLWAPWAWAILHLGKRIENRPDKSIWRSGGARRLIGKWLLIHAGAPSRWSRPYWESVIHAAQGVPGCFEIAQEHYPSIFRDHGLTPRGLSDLPHRMPGMRSLRDRFCSHIVGMVPVVGLRAPAYGQIVTQRMDGWWFTEQWGIELGEPVIFRSPIPAKGTITPLLWPVKSAMLEQVRLEYERARA